MDIFHRSHVIRETFEGDGAGQPKLSDFQRSLLQLKSKLEADGLEHPGTLSIMTDLAILQYDASNFDSVAELFFEVATTRERLLGTEHLAALSSKTYLAWVYGAQDKFFQSASLHEEVYSVRKRILGGRHPDTFSS